MKSSTVFLDAYIAAALWSSSDDNDTPLNELYGAGDLSGELMAQMIDDCADFLAQAGLHDDHMVQAGHDFWLTRNGHGTGFWDRPEVYGDEKGQELTTIAESFGPVDLYVGDDGRIYG